MGSLSGSFQRPLVAAAAVAAASVTADLPEKLSPSKSSVTHSNLEQLDSSCTSNAVHDSDPSWVSQISVSKLSSFSFVSRIRIPLPNTKDRFPHLGHNINANYSCSFVAASPTLVNLYQSAELVKGPKPDTSARALPTSASASASDVVYRWHLPELQSQDISGSSNCSSEKQKTVVVLLGWLGAKQKHLKKYAEWYTSMGFHAITFTFPMAKIMTYQVGGKAEQDIESLVKHLADWLEDELGKNIVFHTFSNTGWLTYGAILEKFQEQDSSLMGKIRGCIVDSAPVAAPDAQVWASGFSAAFLKKSSVATKGSLSSNELGTGVVGSHAVDSNPKPAVGLDPKPAVTEAALLLILEKFFQVILNLPSVNRRLNDVLDVLSSRPPSCPQLYIYSSADRVIPSGSVESFIEEQRRMGLEVRSCDFVSTPHVDHFRSNPQLYTTQLTHFLEDCVLTCCRRPS